MSDYSDDGYYDDAAEAWEEDAYGPMGGGVAGGGKIGVKKIKKKAKPTTVGKQREGGNAWAGANEKACAKGCAKKCCSSPKTTPSLN